MVHAVPGNRAAREQHARTTADNKTATATSESLASPSSSLAQKPTPLALRIHAETRRRVPLRVWEILGGRLREMTLSEHSLSCRDIATECPTSLSTHGSPSV